MSRTSCSVRTCRTKQLPMKPAPPVTRIVCGMRHPHTSRGGGALAVVGMDTLRQNIGLLGAVIERYAVIGVASQEQARVALDSIFNPTDALDVAELILRDRLLPADKPLKDRCGRDAHRQFQFGSHGCQQTVIVPAEDIHPIPTAGHRS